MATQPLEPVPEPPIIPASDARIRAMARHAILASGQIEYEFGAWYHVRSYLEQLARTSLGSDYDRFEAACGNAKGEP